MIADDNVGNCQVLILLLSTSAVTPARIAIPIDAAARKRRSEGLHALLSDQRMVKIDVAQARQSGQHLERGVGHFRVVEPQIRELRECAQFRQTGIADSRVTEIRATPASISPARASIAASSAWVLARLRRWR